MEDVVQVSDEPRSVHDILREKHPQAQPAAPEALLEGEAGVTEDLTSRISGIPEQISLGEMASPSHISLGFLAPPSASPWGKRHPCEPYSFWHPYAFRCS